MIWSKEDIRFFDRIMKPAACKRRFGHVFSSIFFGCFGSFLFFLVLRTTGYQLVPTPDENFDYYRRPECPCSRSLLPPLDMNFKFGPYDTRTPLCSAYATRRGPHQRVISISLFGPKEEKRFQFQRTIRYLHQLIKDVNLRYSDGFILRIYHDNTINVTDVICPIECQHSNVDFCNVTDKLYIPPKIWRFIPAGDPLVDISTYACHVLDTRHQHSMAFSRLVMSRDLDSALTLRERAAVDAWFASNKSFHAMRDHPKHRIRMLGGMWGFRPVFNRSLSRTILDKIHDRALIERYGGRADQSFLGVHVWPEARYSLLVHDSFHCNDGFGHRTVPFPTQRPSANETECFVGCSRPCCGYGKMPFGPCPKQCRPKNHPEWLYC